MPAPDLVIVLLTPSKLSMHVSIGRASVSIMEAFIVAVVVAIKELFAGVGATIVMLAPAVLNVTLKNNTSQFIVLVPPPVDLTNSDFICDLFCPASGPKKLAQVHASAVVALVQVTPGFAVVPGQVVVIAVKFVLFWFPTDMSQVVIVVAEAHHSKQTSTCVIESQSVMLVLNCVILRPQKFDA